MLNYDSRVVNFGDDFKWKYDQQFIRPTLDSKTFTGKVFEKPQWEEFRERMLSHPEDTTLRTNTQIQIAMPKKLTQEVRHWVVGGKVITSSVYRRGSFLIYDGMVDQDSIDYAQKMVDIFQLSKSFVIDTGLTENGWKIIECGSISCCGFYDADMQKIIMNLEEEYGQL